MTQHLILRTPRTLRIGRCFAPLVALAALAGPPDARAQAAPPAEGVVTLTASASVEVPKDWMSVTFSTSREGPDANAVQAQIKSALDAALAEARRAARPDGRLEVQTGAFELTPRYSAKGALTGWVGRTELLVQGRDMTAIAQLAGHVDTLSVERLGYDISREAREKVEGDVAAQAIARFRAKAADVAKAFGYGGYVLREVTVQTESPEVVPRGLFMAKATQARGADDPLPFDAGKGRVTATVSGAVQLVK